jgi:hypothetical protein
MGKSENWPHAFKRQTASFLAFRCAFPYKLKHLIDLACQRNMLFTFEEYGPALNIDKAFVAYVRGQSEEAGFQSIPPPGFDYATKYIGFWLLSACAVSWR